MRTHFAGLSRNDVALENARNARWIAASCVTERMHIAMSSAKARTGLSPTMRANMRRSGVVQIENTDPDKGHPCGVPVAPS